MRTSLAFAAILLMAIAFSASTTISDPKSFSQRKTLTVAPKSSARVQFITRVDKLRMRKSPDLNAPVVMELPEKSYVRYLHETGGEPTEVTLRGVKYQGLWYKVAWPHYADSNQKTVEGWVFSGAVALSYVEFSGDIATELNFDFLKATKITKAQFDAQAALYQNNFVDDTEKYFDNGEKVKLPLENGQVKLVGDAPCKSQPGKEHDHQSYKGQFPKFGWYLIGSDCEHFEIYDDWGYLVRKSDGKIEVEIPESIPPMIAPNGQSIAVQFSEDCGAVVGIDFFRLQNQQWTQFSLTYEDPISVQEVAWSQDSQQCFVKWNVYAGHTSDKVIGTRYCSIAFGQ